MSVSWLVGWLVGRLVSQLVELCFFYDFISLTTLLLPKWSGDLGTAPAHPHATGVAVYPALFFYIINYTSDGDSTKDLVIF